MMRDVRDGRSARVFPPSIESVVSIDLLKTTGYDQEVKCTSIALDIWIAEVQE